MSGLNKYQEYILNAAFKNAVKNKPNTSNALAWYEENGDIKKRIDLASIWIDSDYIPDEAPELDNGQIYYYTLPNGTKLSILKKYDKVPLLKVNGTSSSFKSDLLVDSIESSYGTKYAVKLYDSRDDELPFGLNKWVVDPTSGIVTFIDGIPSGYTTPFYISFYKYVGKKGSDGLLTTDGRKVMLESYVPTDDKSLVTKDYVDSNITDTNSILTKLIPNTPDTFEGKDLELINSHRPGYLLTSTDPQVEVVYIDDNNVSLHVPQFWDENGKGWFTIEVNGNEIYKVTIADLENNTYEGSYITINNIVDSYSNDIVADGFYKSIDLNINLNYLYDIAPYISKADYQIVSVNVRWYSNADTEGYVSNKITFGLDKESKKGTIENVIIDSPNIINKYISGVPAMVKNDKFNLSATLRTLKNFRTKSHGSIEINGIFKDTVDTLSIYPSVGYPIEYNKEVCIPENVYCEQMNVKVVSSNLDCVTNAESNYTWNIRIDSVSDESNRVTSPDKNKLNYGYKWTDTYQMQSLEDSNELQMLNGQYQWPRGNYALNGTRLAFDSVWSSGPNYDSISKDGIRYVTFKYTLNNANGFYFVIDNAEGFESDYNNKIIKNISLLECIVDGHYDWLNMNLPFSGVLSPFDAKDKGCLVVNRSTVNKRYCTFGTEVISGNMYIVLGIPYNLDIKLSGISISVDD